MRLSLGGVALQDGRLIARAIHSIVQAGLPDLAPIPLARGDVIVGQRLTVDAAIGCRADPRQLV